MKTKIKLSALAEDAATEAGVDPAADVERIRSGLSREDRGGVVSGHRSVGPLTMAMVCDYDTRAEIRPATSEELAISLASGPAGVFEDLDGRDVFVDGDDIDDIDDTARA